MLYTNNSDIMGFTAIFLYDRISFLTLKVQLLVKTLEGRVVVKRYSGCAWTVRFKRIHVIHYLFTSIFVNSDIMVFTAISLYDWISFLTLKVQLLVKTLEGRVRVKWYSGCVGTVSFKRIHVKVCLVMYLCSESMFLRRPECFVLWKLPLLGHPYLH